MYRFFVHWIVVTTSLAVAAWVIPGVHISSFAALLVGGLVLGLVNALVRPVLAWLTFPLTILTLGLFYLVVNGVAFALAAALVPGFSIDGLGWAIVAAFVVSLLSWGIGGFARDVPDRRERA